MLSLGLWQMESFRDQGEEALIARINEPAAELTEVAPIGVLPRDGYGRTVTAQGSYLPDQQLLIIDPVEPDTTRVLTAFQLADGSVVPVVRGVSADTPAAPPTGQSSVRGVLLPTEAEPETELPPGQLGSVRLPRITQLWPQQLVSGFIVLDAEGAAAQGLIPAEVVLPSNAGQARNQGYALQWWIFAAAAVAATVKLSRDAAKGTGFMTSTSQAVDEGGDSVDKSENLSTGDGATAATSGPKPTMTVDKPTTG